MWDTKAKLINVFRMSTFDTAYFFAFSLNHISLTSMSSEFIRLHTWASLELKRIYNCSWPDIYFGDPLPGGTLDREILTFMMSDLGCTLKLSSLCINKEELKFIDKFSSFTSNSNKLISCIDVFKWMTS